MTIFAVDSAGKTAGVALWREDALVYESYLATGHTHSETLLALCDAAFSAVKLTPADVDLFAACAGPGSFTGLRIGLALVKGLAFAKGTECLTAPVSTLEALAYSACADGLVAAALDARRGEVYCALFLRKGETVTRLSADGTMPAPAFARQAAEYGQQVLCMGDGALLVTAAWEAHIQQTQESQSANLALYPAAQRFGRAGGVCLAALAMHKNGGCVSAPSMVPQYHRLSQAERERAERQTTPEMRKEPIV